MLDPVHTYARASSKKIYGKSGLDYYDTVVEGYKEILDNKYAYMMLMHDYHYNFLSYLTRNNTEEKIMARKGKRMVRKVLRNPDYKQTLETVKLLDIFLIVDFVVYKEIAFCSLEIFVNAIICVPVWTKYKRIVKVAWIMRRIFGFFGLFASFVPAILTIWSIGIKKQWMHKLDQLALLYLDWGYLVDTTFDLYLTRVVRSTSIFSMEHECGNMLYIRSYMDPCFNLKLVYYAETFAFYHCLSQLEANTFAKDLDCVKLAYGIIALVLSSAQNIIVNALKCMIPATTFMIDILLTRNLLGRKWKAWQSKQKWFVAAEQGNIEFIRTMLETESVHVNFQRPTDGETCLTIACRLGRRDIVQILLNCNGEKGKCDINTMTCNGDFALAISASMGHTDVVSR